MRIEMPKGSPDRPVRHWTWKQAWEAERMRQARFRRQLLHAQRRCGGICGRGVEFFSPMQRLLYLSIEKIQTWPRIFRREKKIPLPERL